MYELYFHTAAFKFKAVEFAGNSWSRRVKRGYRVSRNACARLERYEAQVGNATKFSQITSSWDWSIVRFKLQYFFKFFYFYIMLNIERCDLN